MHSENRELNSPGLRDLIPPENVQEVRIPFSGHGVVTFLLEVGLLKHTTLSLLLGRRVETRELRKDRRRSTEYLITLSQRLTDHRKFRQLAAVNRVSNLYLRQKIFDSLNHETVAEQHQILLERLCRPNRVADWALKKRIFLLNRLFEWLETMKLKRLGFDEIFYLRKHSDVLELGINPALHYIRHGRREGRVVRFLYDRARI